MAEHDYAELFSDGPLLLRAARDLEHMTAVYHYAQHPLANPYECESGLCARMHQRAAELRAAHEQEQEPS